MNGACVNILIVRRQWEITMNSIEILSTIGILLVTSLFFCNWLAKCTFDQKKPTKHHSIINLLPYTIITTLGLLSLSSIFWGILAIILKVQQEPEVYFFGAELHIGHMGVIFVSNGLLVAYFTVRTVLNNAKKSLPISLNQSKE